MHLEPATITCSRTQAKVSKGLLLVPAAAAALGSILHVDTGANGIISTLTKQHTGGLRSSLRIMTAREEDLQV